MCTCSHICKTYASYIYMYNTLSTCCSDKCRATLTTTKEGKTIPPAGQRGQMDIWLQHQNRPHLQAVMYCRTSTPWWSEIRSCAADFGLKFGTLSAQSALANSPTFSSGTLTFTTWTPRIKFQGWTSVVSPTFFGKSTINPIKHFNCFRGSPQKWNFSLSCHPVQPQCGPCDHSQVPSPCCDSTPHLYRPPGTGLCLDKYGYRTYLAAVQPHFHQRSQKALWLPLAGATDRWPPSSAKTRIKMLWSMPGLLKGIHWKMGIAGLFFASFGGTNLVRVSMIKNFSKKLRLFVHIFYL